MEEAVARGTDVVDLVDVTDVTDVTEARLAEWLQALTTLELAEAHFGLERKPIVDLFRARELAARLALGPESKRCLH